MSTASTERPAAAGEVIVERDGSVLRVMLSNERKRNAFTWQMYDQLERVRDLVDADPDLRVVVIRGAGGRAFAAGTDIAQFVDFTTAQQGVDYEHRVGRVLDALLGVRVPIVAVVEGPAAGAGLAVAACCDIVVATEDAVFGAPIARTLGNCLPIGVVALLQRRMGAGRTMSLLLSSELMTADAAAAAGLVTSVVSRAELDAHVQALVQRITSSAPMTLAALKELNRRLASAALAMHADDVLAGCYGSADFREGVSAFVERRTPQWEGR